MLYERSLQIEERFGKTLELIGTKRLNTGQLAGELGVSAPTVQRIIIALRRRGHEIRAVRDEAGWWYELDGHR